MGDQSAARSGRRPSAACGHRRARRGQPRSVGVDRRRVDTIRLAEPRPGVRVGAGSTGTRRADRPVEPHARDRHAGRPRPVGASRARRAVRGRRERPAAPCPGRSHEVGGARTVGPSSSARRRRPGRRGRPAEHVAVGHDGGGGVDGARRAAAPSNRRASAGRRHRDERRGRRVCCVRPVGHDDVAPVRPSSTTHAPTRQTASAHTSVRQCGGRSSSTRVPGPGVELLDEQVGGLVHPVVEHRAGQLDALAAVPVPGDPRPPGLAGEQRAAGRRSWSRAPATA